MLAKVDREFSQLDAGIVKGAFGSDWMRKDGWKQSSFLVLSAKEYDKKVIAELTFEVLLVEMHLFRRQ
jgi:hypothetical protein